MYHLYPSLSKDTRAWLLSGGSRSLLPDGAEQDGIHDEDRAAAGMCKKQGAQDVREGIKVRSTSPPTVLEGTYARGRADSRRPDLHREVRGRGSSWKRGEQAAVAGRWAARGGRN